MSLFSKLFSKKCQDRSTISEEPKVGSSVQLNFSVEDDGKKQLRPVNPDYLLGKTEAKKDEVLMIEQGGFNVREMYGTSEGRKYEIPCYKLPELDLFAEQGQLHDGSIRLAELLGSDKYQNAEYALPCVVGKTAM